jgi:peptidyl-prolyl cis-trans isomerase A (cyclophilin A)
MAKRRRKYDKKKMSKHERRTRTRDKHEHDYKEADEPKPSHRERLARTKSKRTDLMVIVTAVIIIFAVIGVYFIYDQYLGPHGESSNESETPITPKPQPSNGVSYDIPDYQASDPTNPIVIMEVRDYGVIVLELYQNKVSSTVQNFLDYVDMGFYDGLIFHRVIDDFMIQSGGFDPDLNEITAPNPAIPLEIDPSLIHVDGALAMARKSYGGPDDPDGKNTATSQFYICDGRGPSQESLDGNYAVFGQVIAGIEHVRAISLVETHTEKAPNGMDYENVPVKDVIINRIYQLI